MNKIPVYKIDRGVPVPKPRADGFPLEDMELGDSFVFDREDRSRIQIKASRLKKKTGKEYTVRVEDDKTCRIWRIQ